MQHRTQHATRSDTPHPAATLHAAATVHPAATTPRPARTTQQRRAPALDGDEHRQMTLRRRCRTDPAPSRRRTSWRSSVWCAFFFVYIFFCCLTPVFDVYSFFFFIFLFDTLFLFLTVPFLFFFLFDTTYFFFSVQSSFKWLNHPPFFATPSAIFLWRIFGFPP